MADAAQSGAQPHGGPTAAHAADLEQRMQGSVVLQELRRMIGVASAVGPAVAARAGLSSSELEALEHLIGEPLGPVEIARRLRVTSAASSGIVDRLERRGHVVREPHPDDRRRTRVVVTPSGRAEVVAHLVPMFAGLAEAEAALTDRDREVVAAFLRRATDAMTAVM